LGVLWGGRLSRMGLGTVLRRGFWHRCHTVVFASLLLLLPGVLLLACGSRQFIPVTDPMPPPPHPPMGWNSWYAFSDKISDSLIRQQADAMLANGMHQVGYEYVNIDDGWEGDRDAQGVLHPNANFPDMKALGDYLHSQGLKFGIYTSMGPKTCTGRVGSYGHEDEDAQTFVDWGVDFVKYDLCAFEPAEVITEEALVHKMSLALRSKETHSVVLSIVVLQTPWTWAPPLAVNTWRISLDAEDSYENMMQIADFDAGLAPYASRTGWNDPDMLQVGRAGMTLDEYRTHMTLWAMLAAPLLSSTDLTSISPSDLEILTNADVIAINQDPEARQANRVSHGPAIDVWVKSLSSGWAVAIVNRRTQSTTFMFDSKDLRIASQQAYEVWTKQTIALPYAFVIPAHGCVLLKMQ